MCPQGSQTLGRGRRLGTKCVLSSDFSNRVLWACFLLLNEVIRVLCWFPFQACEPPVKQRPYTEFQHLKHSGRALRRVWEERCVSELMIKYGSFKHESGFRGWSQDRHVGYDLANVVFTVRSDVDSHDHPHIWWLAQKDSQDRDTHGCSLFQHKAVRQHHI